MCLLAVFVPPHPLSVKAEQWNSLEWVPKTKLAALSGIVLQEEMLANAQLLDEDVQKTKHPTSFCVGTLLAAPLKTADILKVWAKNLNTTKILFLPVLNTNKLRFWKI